MGGPAMDCLANPVGAVRLLFEKAASQISDARQLSSYDWGVRELFENFVDRPGMMEKIPEVNTVPLHTIPANSLVRFRGMGPDGIWHTTKYTDVASTLIDMCKEQQVWERHLLYCVPVPGESRWCREPSGATCSGDADVTSADDAEMQQREKREREEGMETSDDTEGCGGGEAKRQQTENGIVNGSGQSRETCKPSQNRNLLNIPLGEPEGSKLVPCLVKVYDNVDAELKLNDVVEFIGILTFDPELSAAGFSRNGRGVQSGGAAASGMCDGDDVDGHSNMIVVDEDMLVDDDNFAVHLPYSKVPRLHCICIRRVISSNPLLSHPGSDLEVSTMAKLPEEASALRQSLVERLSKLLGGDHLAADYLLLQMFSRVLSRKELRPIGSLSLNLTACPTPSQSACTGIEKTGLVESTGVQEPTFGQKISHSISLLLPRTHLVPLTLEELNGHNFVPWKDYEKNRLSTGILQLSEGTHLTLDETLLKPGRLTEVGVANVQSLKKLMQLQQVDYDFKYHTMTMQADVQMLILSQGKSLLPADVVLPLRSTAPVIPLHEEDNRETLPKWRHYIGLAQRLGHSIDGDVRKVIEADIIAARKEDPLVGTDTFHR
ncbi:hypothetical protein CBR_g29836 [Chara braunii]|uniref:Mini-chromosome maintenance complex-binding protein n=1 Tax=Chara braunii TaxID=69332 RepID=A0A388JWS5_CHABU|nr:hypothetical protein CBR_g29836 [Chara braunii]|eukprot:GBG62228.1 hypothetical protein CBR_g29836 [Chara braunii]